MNADICKRLTFFLTFALLTGTLTGCESREIMLTEEMPTPDFQHDTPTGEITSDVVVDQTFTSSCNKITGIELYGATYMRTNAGHVNISIYSCAGDDIRSEAESGLTKILTWELNAADFEDNSLIRLTASDAIDYTDAGGKSTNRDLKGRKCMLKISSPDGIAGSCVTFWTTQEDEYPDGCIRIGEYEQYNDLWFQVIGTR